MLPVIEDQLVKQRIPLWRALLLRTRLGKWFFCAGLFSNLESVSMVRQNVQQATSVHVRSGIAACRLYGHRGKGTARSGSHLSLRYFDKTLPQTFFLFVHNRHSRSLGFKVTIILCSSSVLTNFGVFFFLIGSAMIPKPMRSQQNPLFEISSDSERSSAIAR